jgi:hypothetical protein
MRIVIKQTIEYTSGLFLGTKTVRYTTVYSEKEKSQVMKGLGQQLGSRYKILTNEIVKNTKFTENDN